MEMIISFDGNKKVSAHWHGFTIATDQPESAGGENSAPTPFDLFLASMGTCAGIYVKGFCDQRGIPTEGIRLVQHMTWDNDKKVMSHFNIDIEVPADFPEKYHHAVVAAAEQCTVKRHFTNIPEFQITLKNV
ncbi:MAG: OsmC family protein [Bacteroidota bacterium]